MARLLSLGQSTSEIRVILSETGSFFLVNNEHVLFTKRSLDRL